MKKTIIEVQGLKKKFKEQEALAESFLSKREKFLASQTVWICKTTTINILTGQLSADDGTAHVLSAPVEDLKAEVLSRLGLSAMAVVFMKKMSLL